MTEQVNNEPAKDQLPEAVVQARSRFSLVWLIPLVAAVIGAWLAYKAFSEQGPTITISFKTAEGLEAGKTKLKYKNVEIGQVEEIQLSEDLARVVVTAQLVKGAVAYLTEDTRFWVVRARVAAGQVSGLGTLFAGAYIGVDPVLEGERTYHFTGLETPPIVTTREPGRHFLLHADELGSLQVGSPVYFREIKVGEVVAYKLDNSGQSVDIQVFVRAPHHERVHENTRFWNASGLDVSLNAGGLAINTQSLVSLLIGGVAFATPATLTPGPLAKEDTLFRLYSSRQNAFEQSYTRASQWLLRFTGSARGLAVGAPVEFKGIQIGQVLDVKVEFDLNEVTAHISVLIELEPERLVLIGIPDDSEGENEENIRKQIMDRLVARGLRGQLKTGNLLTGALYVELDIFPNAALQPIVWQGRYPELPTVPTPLEELENALAKALEKFKQLPLEQMGSDLQQSLAALRQTAVQLEQLLAELNTTAAPALSATLEQMQKTLRTTSQTLLTANQTLAPDSALQQEAQRVLRELTAAARSIRTMADYLERHPDALLRGKR